MKSKILCLTILLMALFKIDLVYAACDNSIISRGKSIVSNVNIKYDYHITNGQAYFDITLTNLTNDIYFIDNQTDKVYRYSNTNNGEITIRNVTTSGGYKFYSSNSGCSSQLLATKYYTLPIYNTYYTNSECKNYPGFEGCKKWTDKLYTYKDFQLGILKYQIQSETEKDTVVEDNNDYEEEFLTSLLDFYVKYYYIILIVVIAVCITLIYLKNKKEKFDV